MFLLYALGCCPGVPDGFLPEGTWGGEPEPVSLTVNADGTGSLDLACTGGTSTGTIDVVDGVVSAVFSFDPDSWGPDVQGDEPPFEVGLDGTVCGRRLDGHVVGEHETWGVDQDLVVVLGRGRGFEVGCAQ